MNEYVHVEFIATSDDVHTLVEKIDNLGDEFKHVGTSSDVSDATSYHNMHNRNFSIGDWFRISGRISASYASIIKLQDPFLAERMRVSYISDELKNRYRS